MKVIALLMSIFALAGMPVFGRVFTDKDGRTMEAELISASESEVTVKLKKSGRIHRIKIASLSKADVAYVEAKRTEVDEEAARKAELIWGAQEVVSFVLKSKGKKVGDGECWTLADLAFKKAKISRPGKDVRIWGGLVNWKKEDVLPGDILELRSAKFSNGVASGPEHTAVVIKKGRRKGMLVVYHQNWGAPGKTVSQATFNLEDLEEGEAMVYRYGKR